MLSKESKIRTLENFHALDYVFFGKPITEIQSCCPLVKEEYMAIKGALLSVHIEMLKLVEHTPVAIEEKVDSSGLIKQAKASAKIARENSQSIVTTDKSREHIKQTLKEMFKEDKEMNLVKEMKNQIRQQAFSLAVDNLLIGRIVKESKAFDKLNEWEGTIIEDSYKILRSNLVESAYEILESKDEEEVDDDKDDKEEDSKEEVEESVSEDDIKERINELHLNEFWEFGGALDGIGQQLQATYQQCKDTKCHKSSGIKRGALGNFSKVGRACTDLCWVAALSKASGIAKSAKSRCKSAKNPEKCGKRFDWLIARYIKAIAKYKANAAKKMAAAKK